MLLASRGISFSSAHCSITPYISLCCSGVLFTNKGVTNLNNLGIKNYEKINNIIIEKFLNIFA